jgi:hypothetical protein
MENEQTTDKKQFSEDKSKKLNDLKNKSGQRTDLTNDPKVAEYIKKEVQDGLKSALKGTPPKANTTDATEQEIKKFEKMTYKERLHLFNTNPQSYNKLAKGAKQ